MVALRLPLGWEMLGEVHSLYLSAFTNDKLHENSIGKMFLCIESMSTCTALDVRPNLGNVP